MRNYFIITIALLLSCSKTADVRVSTFSVDDRRVQPVAVFNSDCFDGAAYHVAYKLSGIKGDDLVYGGTKFKHTTDTISKILLPSVNGNGTFTAPTDSCEVTVYILVTGAKGASWSFRDKPHCTMCN